ncbi:MAG: CdaR family protein [Candidatus Dormibacteraeota bacterium]|nr:CdaR family protein [Candidatus Dormibacteraeota bacterium]
MTVPGFLRRNIQLKVMATFLATITWAGVVFASNPPDTRTVTVKVPQDTGTVDPWVLVHAIGDLSVQVSGTREHLNAFSPADLVVTVDYRAIKVIGTQQIPVTVLNNDRDVALDNPPTEITASVDRLGSRDVPVTVVYTTNPPQGYTVTSTSANPSAVTVVGPEQQLPGLQAKVAVNLTGRKTDLQVDGPVVIYDAGGQPVGNFGVLVAGRQQSSVGVTVTIAASISSRISAVLPPHIGQPAPGTEIVGISVNPATVVLTGPQDLLNNYDSVSTQVISLAGINGNRTYTVTVEPPPGVSAVPRSVTVVVTVLVISVPTPSPTP